MHRAATAAVLAVGALVVAHGARTHEDISLRSPDWRKGFAGYGAFGWEGHLSERWTLGPFLQVAYLGNTYFYDCDHSCAEGSKLLDQVMFSLSLAATYH